MCLVKECQFGRGKANVADGLAGLTVSPVFVPHGMLHRDEHPRHLAGVLALFVVHDHACKSMVNDLRWQEELAECILGGLG